LTYLWKVFAVEIEIHRKIRAHSSRETFPKTGQYSLAKYKRGKIKTSLLFTVKNIYVYIGDKDGDPSWVVGYFSYSVYW
jgi:hypothetical protein